jgi:hypothetical protein
MLQVRVKIANSLNIIKVSSMLQVKYIWIKTANIYFQTEGQKLKV